MDWKGMQDAYENDPQFHVIADQIFHFLMRGYLSIYEVRDACTYAMNKFAKQRPLPPFVVGDSETVDAAEVLKALENQGMLVKED